MTGFDTCVHGVMTRHVLIIIFGHMGTGTG